MKNTRLLGLIILLLIAGAAIFRFWDVVMLFFLAAIIAYLLSPLVKLLTFGGRVPRGLAVAVTALGVAGLLVWLVVLFVPYAIQQISGVVEDLMLYAGSFDQLLDHITEVLASWHLPQEVLDWGSEILSKADVYLAKAFNAALNWLMNTTTGIMDMVVVIILIIYFMMDGRHMMEAVVHGLPDRVGVRVSRVLKNSHSYVWRYLGTRVLISLGMAVVSYFGFRFMGLRYPMLFAILAFVMDFIPYFGSLIAGVVDAVFALITGGVSLAVEVLIFVLIVQQIEGNVVAPKLQGKSVDLHPIWVMFALLACSEIWGPAGMLISTPLAAIVKTGLSELYDFVRYGNDEPLTATSGSPAAARAAMASAKAAPKAPAAPEPAAAAAPAAPAPEKAPEEPPKP